MLQKPKIDFLSQDEIDRLLKGEPMKEIKNISDDDWSAATRTQTECCDKPKDPRKPKYRLIEVLEHIANHHEIQGHKSLGLAEGIRIAIKNIQVSQDE